MNFPSVLLFDLGGVLIRSSVFENLNQLLPTPLDMATLKTRWLASSAVQQFERGEIDADAFAASFISEWQLDCHSTAFIDQFGVWSREIFPGALETIRTLRTRYRVGCLSNSNVMHFQALQTITDEFDIQLFSHLLGIVKPDRDIFELALNQCEAEPAAIYFFDDSAENVASAREVGMTAFQVEGFDALLNLLSEQELLPRQ